MDARGFSLYQDPYADFLRFSPAWRWRGFRPWRRTDPLCCAIRWCVWGYVLYTLFVVAVSIGRLLGCVCYFNVRFLNRLERCKHGIRRCMLLHGFILHWAACNLLRLRVSFLKYSFFRVDVSYGSKVIRAVFKESAEKDVSDTKAIPCLNHYTLHKRCCSLKTP